jgi:flagellar basal-body rod protein FlgB
MSWIDTPVLRELSEYLDLAAYRQTLISSNLANVDTPGYRTRDIDFEREMRQAEEHSGSDPPPPRAIEVAGLMERPDGNNVSLDRESLLLARTQLQFRLGVELLRQEFQGISTAIKEGS